MELMLRPGWPKSFRRTITVGRKTRVLVFHENQPVEVSAAEAKALEADIGTAIFEVERDAKGRPRFVEYAAAEVPTETTEATDAAIV